jgi:hypothetical protein
MAASRAEGGRVTESEMRAEIERLQAAVERLYEEVLRLRLRLREPQPEKASK